MGIWHIVWGHLDTFSLILGVSGHCLAHWGYLNLAMTLALTPITPSKNIPLEKPRKTPLEKFFHQYLPNFDLTESVNYRRTRVPKVADIHTSTASGVRMHCLRRHNFRILLVVVDATCIT